MSFGNLLGWFNSKLILGFIFTIVLQPIALFMKLFGYDPLNLKRNNKKTYFIDNRKTKIDLNKIF